MVRTHKRLAANLFLLHCGLLASVAMATNEVPLEASIAGTFTDQPTSEVGVFHSTGIGTGIVSQIGEVTFVYDDYVDFVQNPGYVTIRDNHFSMTDSHGHVVYGHYEGGGDLPTTGVATLYVSYTITGGTGRWTNATGTGEMVIVADLTTHEFWLDAVGTISERGGE